MFFHRYRMDVKYSRSSRDWKTVSYFYFWQFRKAKLACYDEFYDNPFGSVGCRIMNTKSGWAPLLLKR